MEEIFLCFRLWFFQGLLRLLEHNPNCLHRFINSCDDDGNPGISRQEWFTCFKIEGIQVSIYFTTLHYCSLFSKSVSIRKPGRNRQEVIELKSPILLKLGTSVGFGEWMISAEQQVKVFDSLHVRETQKVCFPNQNIGRIYFTVHFIVRFLSSSPLPVV